MPPLGSQILIRPGYADDEHGLMHLAALDSAGGPPPMPLLVAEVDGELSAALSLADGSSIADPFRPTAQLVALLRAHAAAVTPSPPKRRRRVPLLGLAPG
jgi:hypothetical protein